ncbi:VanW family protein [Virgibacillus xinjiangensis]|uniref:VanW family protein n=1 Tax=Virgibacillus xinjiangensis TaxID=393090 RepID=A0ABV7CU64_9BACI
MKKLTLFMLLFLIIMFPMPSFSQSDDQSNDQVILQRAEIEQYALDYTGGIYIDDGKLNGLMNMIEKKVYQAPENAFLDENGQIVEEETGVTIDRSKFDIMFREAFYNDEILRLKVPKRTIYPRVDRAMMEEISKKELGSYVTNFRKTNVERSHNIELAAEAINNHVLFPGETFSFNEVVGERTEEKGYKRAPVIVRGELSEGIGGGICQVSSTLFNAVDLKGVQIVERYAHSRRVPYVPPGRDATVSWWGPDFVFKNLYNEPILIRALVRNGSMIVKIMSTETAEYFQGDD